MKAIGYVRKSKASTEQSVSLEAQQERIEAYCLERGLPLATMLADDGVSGGEAGALREDSRCVA